MDRLRWHSLFVALLVGNFYSISCSQPIKGDTMDLYGLKEPEKIKMSYRVEGGFSKFKYLEVTIENGKVLFNCEDREGIYRGSQMPITQEEVLQLAGYYQAIGFFDEPKKKNHEGERMKVKSADMGSRLLSYQYQDHSKQIRNPNFSGKEEYTFLLRWYHIKIEEFLSKS